ncbi:beta-galactosidase [Caloramator quimbayensis]|uniref:Beta-galactosidase n=1 Tax=Caloramator quimbayensis TaxID=1147123 RepID=A0A1T4WSJ5_9CLOT|nr:glycoside hydrolase family 2 TIM barrel-domain containing protein [Caloramator quimbayensis]SKA79805.1 beta-galactosidase [Caloramator quimbayensis]
MRKILSLNNNWYYKKGYEEGDEKINGLKGFEIVNLPHTNVELPYNYFDEKIFQFISCYKYPLILSEEFKGKKIYIKFNGVMAYAKVYLNGVFLGEHKGGYTPFDVRIDEAYDFNSDDNILTVVVDSTEMPDIPPFGGQIDYLTYGGIYREVELFAFDDLFIENIKIETENILEEEKLANISLFIKNYGIEREADFKIEIKERKGKTVYSSIFKSEVLTGDNLLKFEINGLKCIKLWDIDNPNLYELEVTLNSIECSDKYIEIFGFRKAEFTPDGFYLNGKKIKLIGLNRHQSYPYVGYAMPKRVQEKDALILKNDLHVNIVRTSHYPQSKHFLNKCDEIGLLVFEEMPGWQHIGDDNWKQVAVENVKEMIQRDWNHPSIILWGVRINESLDDDDFYTKTNETAHSLDSTRQTGGVRYITNSNLLEDVYTMNDFIHDGINGPLRNQKEVTGLNYNVPYMVTEFNGHMYPTKRFDQEERQMEHSLRHLRVQNASFLDENICGAIGWCAFDYNTHKDFGSGDRICYHGVMDMFRVPKFASYVYKSQISPEVEAVLEPVTFWARGERSIGGIIPLVIFTNCDYIEFKYGDNPPKKIYPNKEKYKGIPYPPVIIDYSVITPEEAGSWGMIWEDAVITGYYKGNIAAEKRFSKNPLPTKLYAEADDINLNSYEKDATRVVVKVLDQYDNILPFLDEIIKIDVKGPARLIGPNEAVIKGGAFAFWIETINEAGEVLITVKSQRLGEKKITIYIK